MSTFDLLTSNLEMKICRDYDCTSLSLRAGEPESILCLPSILQLNKTILQFKSSVLEGTAENSNDRKAEENRRLNFWIGIFGRIIIMIIIMIIIIIVIIIMIIIIKSNRLDRYIIGF